MPSYYDSTAQTRSAVEASKTVKSYGESVGPRGVKMGKPTTQPQGHVPMKKRLMMGQQPSEVFNGVNGKTGGR
jgi:hypothetical protein|tara:strand:+ start:186 stop:404 length:219 start_codon:yes stop_codon:yes gene_type:complete